MHFTLGISELANKVCDRKTYLYILSRMQKNFIEKEDQVNNFLIIGKALHTILQISSKELFGFIEYYFYRRKQSVEEAILSTFGYCLAYWKFLLKKQIELQILDITDYSEIINEIESQLPVLSNHLASIIYDNKSKKLNKMVIDDEFEVSYQISEGILLTGKIDLVCYDNQKRKLKFIELKTGKPNSIPRIQLRLYKEIFNKKQKKDIILETWNSKSGPKDKGFSKIVTLRKYNDPELDKLKNILKKAIKCEDRFDLPFPISFPNYEKICKHCDYCNHVENLFPKAKSQVFIEENNDWNDFF